MMTSDTNIHGVKALRIERESNTTENGDRYEVIRVIATDSKGVESKATFFNERGVERIQVTAGAGVVDVTEGQA